MTARHTTVADRAAEAQEFREAEAAARAAVPADSLMTTTARQAARTPATVADLRPVTTAIGLMREYGVETPEPLRHARDLIRKAREIADANRMSPTRLAARIVLTAPDPVKAIESAAKARAVEREKVAIADMLHAAAVDEVLAAFREHRDEIANAVLASPVLAEGFEEISTAVVNVPPSAIQEPRADDLGLVAAVARLRLAEKPFEKVLTSLVVSGLVTNPALRGAGHLLYIDPTDADPTAAYRAIRGVRPGQFDANVYTVSATVAPHSSPISAPGIPAAIAAHGTPGARLSLATTVEDWERRVAHVLRGTSPDFIPEGALS